MNRERAIILRTFTTYHIGDSMSTKNTESDLKSDTLARGGMWDRQRLLGGARLTETYKEDESFVLRDLSIVGEVEVEEGKLAPKVELLTSPMEDPSRLITVGTLSKAITELAEQERASGDLPVVCHWTRVETKRKQQPAVVIIADASFSD